MSTEMPYHPEDFSKYEAGGGKLPCRYLILTLSIRGTVEDRDKVGLLRFLESVDAVLAGETAWLIKTDMTPKHAVNAIRHHLLPGEYVCAFSLCNELSWAGPRHLGKFFAGSGVRVQQSEDIPPPVDPTV